ncbi:ABC transporter ATP-binding protein [Marinicrinis lubricantis]|uniref:Nickel import system ATP-binding protein NikD n=1 Tax=Marinicrinis lubricantis TaxID=2086470 RepID=A0ABW1IV39_9BACL
MPILEVKQLSIAFEQYGKGLRQETLKVIHRLELTMNEGEITAVVGSSGSGKSLLAHAILGILPQNAKVTGEMKYDGQRLTPSLQSVLRGKEIAFIPQSVSYLDPLMKAGRHVRLAVREGKPAEEQRRVFEQYRLPRQAEKLYPFQLSGGMARRVLVSTAVVSKARLVIADEPTPGLDPAAIEETLRWLRELKEDGSAVLLITHDLEAALQVADQVAVLYAGTSVEQAPAADFAGSGEALRHPYSRALWRALPQNDFAPLAGTQPTPRALPPGCLFAPRCSHATAACAQELPEQRAVRGGRVRCIHAT